MRAKTLKELASHLDLSITTVSRALAGHEQIALKTRHRVAEAAREHGYVPNTAARTLVSGRSGFVGLVLHVVLLVAIQTDMESPAFVACLCLVSAAFLFIVVASDLFVEVTHVVDLLPLW